jgi:hypothetical protein
MQRSPKHARIFYFIATLLAASPCLVSCTNKEILPGPTRWVATSLEQSGLDSLWVQQQLGIPVVKVFNSICATSLNLPGKPER